MCLLFWYQTHMGLLIQLDHLLVKSPIWISYNTPKQFHYDSVYSKHINPYFCISVTSNSYQPRLIPVDKGIHNISQPLYNIAMCIPRSCC